MGEVRVGIPECSGRFFDRKLALTMEKEEALRGYTWAAILLILGITTGAFGAHALEGVLDAKGNQSWSAAAHYALVMGAATLAAAATGRTRGIGWVQSGAALFSGSIFLLVGARLNDWPIQAWVGPVTPIGGLLMIVGWILWLMALRRPGTARGS